MRQALVRHWSGLSRLLRVALGAAGCMLVLAGCAAVAGAFMSVSADRRAARGPGGAESPIQIGQIAPDFELYTDDERLVSLRDYRGRPVAVNFWATWCLPCRFEIPAMTDAARQYEDEGLAILSVDVGEKPSLVLEFLAERDIAYEVLLDPHETVADAYSIVSMPTTLWIDGDGVIRAVDSGLLTAERIAENVELLTAE